MRFIFDNKFAPLTDSMSFIQCDIDLAMEKYLEWIIPLINEKIEMQINEPEKKWNEYNEHPPLVKKYETNFCDLIELMQPLCYPQKTLLFECKNGWVGFIENLVTGTEIRRINIIASKIDPEKESIGVQAWQNNYDKKANGWCGGSFNLYGGKDNYGFKRYVMLSDQDKWEFDQSGKPLPFEDIQKYNEKLVRNRFTPEMLQKYLLHYGIDFFNDDFYMPQGSKAYIVEFVRDRYDNEESKTLHQRRVELKYETH